MATVSVTYTFTNGTDADADDVNQNFDDLVTFINTDVIHRDASIAFTTTPSGPASDPTTDNQLARKAYVDTQVALKANTSHTHAHTDITDFDAEVNALIAAYSPGGDASGTLASIVVGNDSHNHTSSTLPALSAMSGAVTNSQLPSSIDGKNFEAASGSAAAPSYAFDGDENTGFHNPANGEINVSVDGTDEFRFQGGFFAPTVAQDNANSLGTSGARWTTVYATNGTINTSDERLKTFTGDAPGLSFIDRLSPKVGVWTDGEDGTHMWLSAQNVQAAAEAEGIVDPAFIVDDGENPMGLNYEAMVPALVVAVQQLKAMVK